ncbi:hypothetical protein ACFV2A_28795 [Streptomyces californicus]|uniref:hypothetical protein n=1 Tax=Streptomyces TaxID=1883 RepID=UPI000BF179A1|nr:hypothetical protein [Streptomyces sp. b94]NEC44475.1 hypothetical protein [Streptomyces sp. SID8016]
MSRDRDDEPIIIREKWGTNRYVYNPNNPIGVALIIGSLLFAVGGIYYLHASSSWSEGELSDAVRVAARDLEEHPRTLGSWTGGYESLIRDALKDSGEGPSAGGVLHVDKRTATSATPADKAGDSVERFEVSAKDVDTAFCLSVSPPEPEPGLTSVTVSLSVSVEEGGC